MSVPSTAWRDILYQVCTRDDMIFHCEPFNISHLKSLSKALENAWLHCTEDLARMLPLSELKSLQIILQAGGTLKPSDTMPTEILEVAKLVLTISDDPIMDTPSFDGLMPYYAIPDNLRFALNLVVDGLLNDQTYLEGNRKEQLLLGMIHLYGVISERQLSMVWEQTLNEKWDFVFYRILMKEKVVFKMEIDPSNAIPLWILKGRSRESLHTKHTIVKQKPICMLLAFIILYYLINRYRYSAN